MNAGEGERGRGGGAGLREGHGNRDGEGREGSQSESWREPKTHLRFPKNYMLGVVDRMRRVEDKVQNEVWREISYFLWRWISRHWCARLGGAADEEISAVVGEGAARQVGGVIASVGFRNFKALRQAELALEPFNLVIGPNGSGKTSLIEAMLKLRGLARGELRAGEAEVRRADGQEIVFRLVGPEGEATATLSCVEGAQCDRLEITPEAARAGWPALRERVLTWRAFAFDHGAMARAVGREVSPAQLTADGGNLAAVLARWEAERPGELAALGEALARVLPEYAGVEVIETAAKEVQVGLRLVGEGTLLAATQLSQGTLYLLALLTLAQDPAPPAVIAIEEVDRGIHPRLLREVRDVLYRLSYPESEGGRGAVQVIATTHSPYLLDLWRDHPEEVVIAQKVGARASFTRLADRPDVAELLAEGALGDMWFAGVLGGVPEES